MRGLWRHRRMSRRRRWPERRWPLPKPLPARRRLRQPFVTIAAAHRGDNIKMSIAVTARARAEKAADEAAMSLRVLDELQGKMDTGIRVNPALTRLWGVR